MATTAAPDLADVFAELHEPLGAEEAVLEADRCLGCGGAHAPAPCVVACPAGIDVPSFVDAIAAGDAGGAARTIFAENVLGGSCARACPAEILCEGACVLVHEGRRPVEIAALQRYASDAAAQEGTELRAPAKPNGMRVAVVGAGPAGLAAAGELAARGYAVTVYDERPEPGGLARYAIAPYRLVESPSAEEAVLLERLGVRLRLGVRVDSELLGELRRHVDAIFLGVGLGSDTDPELPGEALPGVWRSLEFVEALKTGCPPELGGRVAVVGGGNTAIDVAREAMRLGAEHVTLVYRRTGAEMPAYPHEVAEALDEGVELLQLAAPTRVLGAAMVEALECRRMELGEPDESGRRRPVPVPDSEFVLPVDTVVLAIGQQARTELHAFLEGFDPETGRTADPKVYAGGDACNGGATVVEAVAEAKRAARAIDAALAGGAR